MKENCFICNKEVEVEGRLCCTGSVAQIECGCHGQEQRVDDKDVICEQCFDCLDNLNEKGFTISENKSGERYDINNTAELI